MKLILGRKWWCTQLIQKFLSLWHFSTLRETTISLQTKNRYVCRTWWNIYDGGKKRFIIFKKNFKTDISQDSKSVSDYSKNSATCCWNNQCGTIKEVYLRMEKLFNVDPALFHDMHCTKNEVFH